MILLLVWLERMPFGISSLNMLDILIMVTCDQNSNKEVFGYYNNSVHTDMLICLYITLLHTFFFGVKMFEESEHAGKGF